jgi:hypothetical protein
MKQCEFALVPDRGNSQYFVCTNCGRPLRLRVPASSRIIATCRGDAETRWHRDGRVRNHGKAGTALKSLLATIGITATPNCSCNARANEMDARGCDWCEDNLDTIVGWLREEATKRGLPFLDAAGRLLVRRAIRNARRAAAN